MVTLRTDAVFLSCKFALMTFLLLINIPTIHSYIVPKAGLIHRRSFTVSTSTHRVEPLQKIMVESKRTDNFLERFAILCLSSFLIAICPDKLAAKEIVKPGMTFGDFVTLTKLMLRFGTADDIRKRITGLLNSIMPAVIRKRIRVVAFHKTKWLSEKSSLWMRLGFLTWLVGPVQRFHVPVEQIAVGNPGTEAWYSGVKLEKCRYLAEAGCKSACLHLCKAPTQEFFNKDLGLPLYMKPNFEDSSCEMFFGVSPPAMQDDPAHKEPCYATCSSANNKRVRDKESGNKVSSQHPLLSSSTTPPAAAHAEE
jgi:hypothetical protein